MPAHGGAHVFVSSLAACTTMIYPPHTPEHSTPSHHTACPLTACAMQRGTGAARRSCCKLIRRAGWAVSWRKARRWLRTVRAQRQVRVRTRRSETSGSLHLSVHAHARWSPWLHAHAAVTHPSMQMQLSCRTCASYAHRPPPSPPAGETNVDVPPEPAVLQQRLREMSTWEEGPSPEAWDEALKQTAAAVEAGQGRALHAALAASEAAAVPELRREPDPMVRRQDPEGPPIPSQDMPSASQVPAGGLAMPGSYVETVWAFDLFHQRLVTQRGGAGGIARLELYKRAVCVKYRLSADAPPLTMMEPYILWQLRNSNCSVRVLGHTSTNVVCPTNTLLVQEWCEVTPWKDKRIAGGLAEAVRLLGTGFRSIHQMHANRIAHLNLEPAHWLLVGAAGQQRVIMCGFGHARRIRVISEKLACTGLALSTCNQDYLAPEARDAVDAPPRTRAHSIRVFLSDLDVFAAGAAALHLLTGLPISADELRALGGNRITQLAGKGAHMVVEEEGGFLDRMTVALADSYALQHVYAATKAKQLLAVLGPCLAGTPAERPLAVTVAKALEELSGSM